MRKLNIKWFDLAKWLTQFFLSSFLILLVDKCLIDGGDKGTIVMQYLVFVTLAATLGTITGDISLYRGDKFTPFSVLVAIIFGYIGAFIGLIVISRFESIYPVHKAVEIIGDVVWLLVIIAPPIICYNGMTKVLRKGDLVEKGEAESESIE